MTKEQNVIAANAAYIEELIREELQEAHVENIDLEFELEYTQKQLKAANESSECLTQDVIQSEKNIADLREELEKTTGELDRLTNSNKALKLALELKQLNGPDVSELKKEIRQLQGQNDELTRICAPFFFAAGAREATE